MEDEARDAAEEHDTTKDDLDLGPQPLAGLLQRLDLSPNDLVAASGEQLTHKMVARGAKGRRLTKNTMEKLLRALNKAAARGDKPNATYAMADLFNYAPRS
jgi:hypothetical protein